MGELTNSGGLRDCDKESDNEKLELEHCDVGGVVTWWLASSKESTLAFISFSLSCKHEKSNVWFALPPSSPVGVFSQGFHAIVGSQ